MNIGPAVEVEIYVLDDKEVSIEFYDANGFCCGGVSIAPDGTISATLIGKDNVVLASDSLKLEETMYD